jgi:hypothetical protein
MSRHRPRHTAASLSILLIGCLLLTVTGGVTGPAQATSEPAPTTQPYGEGAVVTIDGDAISVQRDPSSGVSAGAPQQRATPGGYTLAASGLGINSSYDVRMVTDHPDWTKIDEEVADVADDLSYITGGDFDMASSVGAHTYAAGDITVQVNNNSPCGYLSNPGTIGCGQVWWTGPRVDTGQVWICTCMTSDPTLPGLVLHEMGHAIGLGHYASSYEGLLQVMYPVNYPGISFYRSGDVNGIRKLTANGFGGGTAPTHPPGATTTPSVANGGFGDLDVSWGAAPSFGKPIDQHQIQVENTATHSVKTVTVGSSRSASASVTGGDYYRARVRAHNSKGWGPWSGWSGSSYVTGRCLDGITDVPETSDFCDDITWLLAEDIASGYDDDTFRPGNDVTRQAMAAFLMRDAERLVPGSTSGNWSSSDTFDDVPSDHPFHDEIEWLASTGITNGFSDGTFRPENDINRMSMAAMLKRFTEYLYPGSTAGNWSASPFSDVPPSKPFHDEITWLASTGITNGYPDGTFHPDDDVSRQAMAAFLYRHDAEYG